MSSVEPHRMHDQSSEPAGLVGRTEMYTMYEALAREHMRQRSQDVERHRLASELAAANRWRYLERRASAAHRRHAHRAEQYVQATALAD